MTSDTTMHIQEEMGENEKKTKELHCAEISNKIHRCHQLMCHFN